MADKTDPKSMLRRLPKVDQVLGHPSILGLAGDVPEMVVKAAVRAELEELRGMLLSGFANAEGRLELALVAEASARRALLMDRPKLRRVVNATGVVIHTNLGRSPLSEEAVRHVALAASGYTTLEYDLATGQRGSRDDLVDELICRLTGAEAATVVNNNAAAVLLMLRAVATGRSVIVSRGELVEIGGSFRIPDVMAASGARLVEVGTTNRTRIGDYRAALNPEVALLLKVHTSNYRIVGFAEEVSAQELASLGQEAGVTVAVDLGSGCLVDLRSLGLVHAEPTVGEVLRSGVDLVTFSGDKLLGGPQAGVIVGKAELVHKLRRDPMKRALRTDKMTLAALEAVLRAYLDPKTLVSRIPVLRMMASPRQAVAARARRFARRLSDLPLRVSFAPSVSRVGGGALPLEEIPTVLLALEAEGMPAQALEERLRAQDPPVVGRIVDDRLCLDMRTVLPGELGVLERAIRGAVGRINAARDKGPSIPDARLRRVRGPR